MRSRGSARSRRRFPKCWSRPAMAAPPPNARVRNVDVAAEDIAGLVSLAKSEKVGLTIIGPEGPLVLGVVDAFAAAGLRCFGPRKAAAQLEGSKAYHQGIPEAPRHSHRGLCHLHASETFDPDWVRRQRTPIVVKASGLAAGKGVVIVDIGGGSHRHCAVDVRRPVRLRGRPGGHRRIPAGRRSQLHRHGRWQEHPGVRHVAGSQAIARCRRGSEHRRHGRLFARARGRLARCTNASCARSSSPPFAASPKTARRTPAFSTPASWCIPTARPMCSSTTAASAIRRRSPS